MDSYFIVSGFILQHGLLWRRLFVDVCLFPADTVLVYFYEPVLCLGHMALLMQPTNRPFLSDISALSAVILSDWL